MSETCPKCGAEFIYTVTKEPTEIVAYECGSGFKNGEQHRIGTTCLTNQLTAAQARIAELEAVCQTVIDGLPGELEDGMNSVLMYRGEIERLIKMFPNSGPAAEGA